MKISEVKTQKGFKLLQLSESGSGKSTRALDAIRFGKVCVIDIDNKLKELVDANADRFNDTNVDLASVLDPTTKTERMVRSVPDIRTFITNAQKAFAANAAPFSTLVMDTLSEFQDIVEQHHATSNKKSVLEFSFPDWRAVKELNMEILRGLLSLPCNVIINAHLKKDKNVFDQIELVPGLTGKAGEEAQRAFNEIHFLKYKDKKYVAFGRPQPTCSLVKTLRDKSLLDESGAFKVSDLSIFDSIAFKGGK